MQGLITKAVDNFFKETLGFDSKKDDKFESKGVYVSSVFIEVESKKDDFFLTMTDELLKEVSKALFFDDEPDHETKIDLIGECANLIIGNLKVLLSDTEDIELGTPEYQGYFEDRFSKEFDDNYYFKVGEHKFMIGVQRVENTVDS
jgi:CheY-specific phosphatase CheX